MATGRLVHTPAGFLRYMQMSRASVFAFVEGKQHDPFVFGMICASVCRKRKLTYEVCKACELPDGAGGKTALLAFHDHLRRRRALRSVLGGKATHAVFFLDKDIDDILRRRRRGPHLVYTRNYDIQNDVFRDGWLLQGVAAASSIDPGVLTPLLGDGRRWCRQAAERWRDWVILCIVAACLRINHQCNYRVVSQVQCEDTGAPDPRKVAQMKASMLAKSGVDAATFERSFQSVERRVRRIYGAGEQDRVFKGKWYAAAMDEDLARACGQDGYDRKGFVSRVTAAIAATLSAEDGWARDYCGRVEGILVG